MSRPSGHPDEPGWSTARIDALTSWTLIRAHLVRVPLLVRALHDLGLTPTQFGVLVQLDNSPGLSQAQLARRALMTPQSMGELLVSLEGLGHVRRDTRPGRGHPIPVTLTEQGRRVLAQAGPAVDAIDTAESFGITAEEKLVLNTLLHKVVRHCEDRSGADG